ncbi:hypothetical protein HDE_03850 [Halotydeus destructor]|nr:hypothetical protein HDE_03850 [Halotydeus destructor]
MVWQLLNLRRITAIVFAVNVVLTCVTVYIFLEKGPRTGPSSVRNDTPEKFKYSVASDNDDSWNPWGVDLVEESSSRKSGQQTVNNGTLRTIEIWSKAAIGIYLWEHILRGRIDKKEGDDFYVYGFKKVGNYKFKYRSGPSVTTHMLRHHLLDSSSTQPKNLVIVLNGRSEDKIKFAKSWLDEIKIANKVRPANIGAILLGHESCFNQWIKMYLSKNGGPIKFLFVVYDWKYVDDEDVFQWPLGVATYRHFPNPDPAKLNLQMQRQYACNFLGTVYRNSSREEIAKVLSETGAANSQCFVKTRSDWLPAETRDTLQVYIEALRYSDLTLSPIGMNHECYRIFEALSFGSIPVLEENLSHVTGSKTSCDHSSAYRLLKLYNAPVIYVHNWTAELPNLIARESGYSQEYKVRRRLHAMNWYSGFKNTLRDHFIDVLSRKFEF